MKNLRMYIFAVISGILISLPLSYPSLFFLSWIGLIPLLFAIIKDNEVGYIKYFTTGTLLGTTIIFISSFWLYYPLVEYSGLSFIPAVLLFVLVFVLFGAIYGIWLCVFVFIKNENKVSPFWLAISWTAFEYLRFHFIPALPFGFTAYTQSKFLSLVQFAEYGGIYLVGFLLILINGYLFKTVKNRKLKYLLPVIIFLIIVFTIGSVKISNITNMLKESENISVGVVQSNLSPVEKWKVSNIENNIDFFVNGSSQLSETKLVVWPESAMTFDMVRNEFYRDKFDKKVNGIKPYIQVGSLSVEGDGKQKYNSSFLIGNKAEIIGRYNKNILVPFGEYNPFGDLVERFTGITVSSELAGTEIKIFQLGDIRWKTLICSEILYPDLVRKKIDSIQFLVNQSNEAWYQKGNLQEEMWSAAVFRSVENRRSVVKSGNKAYGGMISPTGFAIIRKHSRELSILKTDLPLNTSNTLYQRWGNYVGYISAIFVATILLIKLILSFFYRKK